MNGQDTKVLLEELDEAYLEWGVEGEQPGLPGAHEGLRNDRGAGDQGTEYSVVSILESKNLKSYNTIIFNARNKWTELLKWCLHC